MKKFLVIQTAFIGDVILATAVVEKLHLFFPEAEIDVMVRKGNESLLLDHPFIRQTLVWNKENEKYSSLWNLLLQVRKEKYNAIINLQRFASSGFITAFSNAKEKIGFDKNPLSFFFTKKFPHLIGSKENPGPHEIDRCLQLIEDLTDGKRVLPKLYPSVLDFERAASLIHSPFITFSPASVWYTKQWPEKMWIDLAKQKKEMDILLLGGPNDKSLCERIEKESGNPRIRVMAGELSLLQSAALMKSAQMNYVNDSAPMHLCSAINAPVTAIFCSTIPEFGFGPLSTSSIIAQEKSGLDCRPCGLHGYKACPKGHFKCSQFSVS